MTLEAIKYTYAQYVAFCDLPENEGRIFELIDGEIVEKMASHKPSKVAARIVRFVDTFVDEHDLGDVTGADGGYQMNDENTFIPDVAFISRERLPVEPAREAPVPPDLAVEVKSPTDRIRTLRRKAERHLELGTKLVWLVFPDEQKVEVYMPDADVISVDIEGVLDGGTALPGFTLPVKNIFR